MRKSGFYLIIPTLSTAIHRQFTIKTHFGRENSMKTFTVKTFSQYRLVEKIKTTKFV